MTSADAVFREASAERRVASVPLEHLSIEGLAICTWRTLPPVRSICGSVFNRLLRGRMRHVKPVLTAYKDNALSRGGGKVDGREPALVHVSWSMTTSRHSAHPPSWCLS